MGEGPRTRYFASKKGHVGHHLLDCLEVTMPIAVESSLTDCNCAINQSCTFIVHRDELFTLVDFNDICCDNINRIGEIKMLRFVS